ncbi:Ig-like domain-containing protein [Faecalispora anaeroviscerum]|uniref:Ig-like domain-containing protein n=1 Tax=Faecalispora anaeroviscerum TaxID=2991836 RepID=UPI0024BAF038|nr:Ig-like domain-containing protein [Faecalispora anaeroviscerum]
MKKDKKTTVILTAILLFMFAAFGGGTILNALGIQLPFLSSSGTASSSSGNTSSQVITTSDSVFPSDIQIGQIAEESKPDSSDLNEAEEQSSQAPSTDRDKSYVVELTDSPGAAVNSQGSTSYAPVPGQNEGPSSSSVPAPSDPGTSSGSASENSSSSSGGTAIPSTRPKPSEGGGSLSVSVQSVALDQSDVTINRQNTLQLTATVAPQNATKKSVTWTSSNPDVATIDDTGKVTAIGAGAVTITATADQKLATCKVTVVVLMDGITLNHTDLSLDKGNIEQLTAKIIPEDTTEDKTITWTSSDPDIVSVDGDGKVTAHKVGKVTVKASAVGASASCEVTVLSPMTGIELDKSTLTLNRNTKEQLTVSFLPVDTTDGRTVTWSSSAPEIADVDQQGNVIAYCIGMATITARCGEYTATCDVTVIALIEGIFLDQTEITLDRGTEGQLTASIIPLDTTEDKTITWVSSNPDIATVDVTGKVNGVKTGTTTITAKVREHTASCNINVVALIHGITLDKSELITLDRSTTGQLAVSYDPPDTTEDKTVTWSSSDPAVATVDEAGNVTAVQIGTATITAQVGTHTATCNITVVALIHGITLAKSELTLDRSTTGQLAVSYDPPDTTEDKIATWSSNNPTVATVDVSGNVTAVQIGVTTITAKVGEHTASCTVNVVALIHSITLDQTSFKINKGDGHQFTVIIDPPDTTDDKTVVWSSSNPAVATIGNDGKLLALTPGNTTITAKTGLHTATCDVRVRDSYAITTAAIGNGSVSPVATVIEDNSITLTATSAVGHHFVSWTSSDGTVIDSATFTYVPDKNITWTALFKIDTYDNTQVTIPTDTTGGSATVSPAAPYTYGQTVTYSATPAKGYHFVNWTSDKGNVETRQTFEWTLTGPIIWTPHFEGNIYTVQATSKSPEKDAGGTITGTGTYHYGDTVTLNAVPDSQFKFVKWTNSAGDEVETSTLSFKLDDKYVDSSTITWTANFILNAFVRADYTATNEFDSLAWRSGRAGLYIDFYGDSYESSKGSLTLTLDNPISVNTGEQLLLITYEGRYYGYTKNRSTSYSVYDENNQVITSGSFSLYKDTEKERDSSTLKLTAGKTSKVAKIVFSMSGSGKYHETSKDDQPSMMWLDFDDITIAGQYVYAIKGYNRPK